MSTIETIQDAPGDRFDISDDGSMLVVGAFYRKGLAAYKCDDGKLLWRRKDLSSITSVRIFDSHCTIEFYGRRARVLDLTSGEDVCTRVRSSSLWVSPANGVAVGSDKKCIYLLDWPTLVLRSKVQLTSFATLDAAFSQKAILVSEPNCCIRAFRMGDFEPLWEWTDPDRRNYVSIFETITPGSMFAFGCRLEEPHKHRVYKIDVLSGERTLVLELRSPQFNVCVDYSGTNLIDNCGNVYTISEDANVQKVRQLEWP